MVRINCKLDNFNNSANKIKDAGYSHVVFVDTNVLYNGAFLGRKSNEFISTDESKQFLNSYQYSRKRDMWFHEKSARNNNGNRERIRNASSLARTMLNWKDFGNLEYLVVVPDFVEKEMSWLLTQAGYNSGTYESKVYWSWVANMKSSDCAFYGKLFTPFVKRGKVTGQNWLDNNKVETYARYNFPEFFSSVRGIMGDDFSDIALLFSAYGFFAETDLGVSILSDDGDFSSGLQAKLENDFNRGNSYIRLATTKSFCKKLRKKGVRLCQTDELP